ncbi:MAG: thioesterase [Lentisphaerae bacterium]|nr:thioesterase [Lentisphaerota bacterium]MCP4102755.1 thioesterase [Lentisphaerota bacterium]
MPKIKLKSLDNYLFNVTIPVRISDINYGNHLSNDSMVSILHEARLRFLQSLGYKDEIGVGMIMQDLAVNFKAESFLNDTLTVYVGVAEKTRLSVRVYYKVENQENKLVALAETGMAFLDYKTRKLAPVPDKLNSC